jgi:hypothetical protein
MQGIVVNKASRVGNEATVSRHREAIASWSNLSNGDIVAIYRGQEVIASGKIDMLAADGSVLWIIQEEGRGRSLFLYEDGFHVIKRQAIRRKAQRTNSLAL